MKVERSKEAEDQGRKVTRGQQVKRMISKSAAQTKPKQYERGPQAVREKKPEQNR